MGGVEAASRLAAAIKDHIAELYPNEGSDWRSVVQIYLNLDGLSRKLYACDIVNSYTFADFIRDFNSTSPLINIIDVGQGKERADHKVRGVYDFPSWSFAVADPWACRELQLSPQFTSLQTHHIRRLSRQRVPQHT